LNTNELTGPALDWAVAKAEGKLDRLEFWPKSKGLYFPRGAVPYRPSQRWAQAGTIIEREGISLLCLSFDRVKGGIWQATGFRSNEEDVTATYTCPLIAAMRCFVACKLGDEIDLPEELK
jgi:hypothetical protein